MCILFLLFLLNPNAVIKTRKMWLSGLILVITVVIFPAILCWDSYTIDYDYATRGVVSQSVNETKNPQYLLALITWLFL